jgi:hypothetical protein
LPPSIFEIGPSPVRSRIVSGERGDWQVRILTEV